MTSWNGQYSAKILRQIRRCDFKLQRNTGVAREGSRGAGDPTLQAFS